MRYFLAFLYLSFIMIIGGCCSTGKTPVRVATKDAFYYHRPDCPRVHESWAAGGEPVYYNRWNGIFGVNLSGRVADNRICFAGREYDESVANGTTVYNKVSATCPCEICQKEPGGVLCKGTNSD